MPEIPRPLMDVVRAHPDDDAPRLVVADWLDEHGDPARAAFVRAQLEAALAPHYAPETLAARRRAAWLEDLHGKRWIAELPALGGIWYFGTERGFVSTAVGARFRDVAEGAAALASHTCVTTLMAPWPTDPEDVRFALPRTVHTLVLTGAPADPRAPAWLSSAPWLPQLRALSVQEDDETVCALPEATALVASAGLRGLRSLELELDWVDAELFDGAPSALETLRVEAGDMSLAFLPRLADWPGADALRSLGLDPVGWARGALVELLRSPRLRGLRALTLATLDEDVLPPDAAPRDLRELSLYGWPRVAPWRGLGPAPWLRGVRFVVGVEADLAEWLADAPFAESVQAATCLGRVSVLPDPTAVPRLDSLAVEGIAASSGRLGMRHLRTHHVAGLRHIDCDALEWLDAPVRDDAEWDAFLATPLARRLSGVEGGLRRWPGPTG